jgi:ribosomal protein L3
VQLKDAAKVGEYKPGQQLEITEMFKEGDNIDIAGTTVGKGFQGAHSCQQQQWQQHTQAGQVAGAGCCQDSSQLEAQAGAVWWASLLFQAAAVAVAAAAVAGVSAAAGVSATS